MKISISHDVVILASEPDAMLKRFLVEIKIVQAILLKSALELVKIGILEVNQK